MAISPSTISATLKMAQGGTSAPPGASMLGGGHTLDANFVADPTFQAEFDDALETWMPPLKKHSLAFVDLTVSPTAPLYAGHNDTRQCEIASLAKILPLYAALQMRADLRWLSSVFAQQNLKGLAAIAREQYRRRGASTTTTPMIEDLFTLGQPGEIDFASSTKTNAELLAVHSTVDERLGRTTAATVRHELGLLSAREQLRLVAGWSDRAAAQVITQSLGFEFLWGQTQSCGLYRKSWPQLVPLDAKKPGAGGLFLGADYNFGRFRGGGAPGFLRAATPRSLATLLTLLAQDRLVDTEADVMLREMLRRKTLRLDELSRENSPIGAGFTAAYWTADQPVWSYDPVRPFQQAPAPGSDLAVSKVGIYDSADSSILTNALLVRTTRNKKSGAGNTIVTAVLVALYDKNNGAVPPPDTYDLMAKFGAQMSDLLTARHGLV